MSKVVLIAGPDIIRKRQLGQLFSLIDRSKLDVFDFYAVKASSEDLYDFFDVVGDIPSAHTVDQLLEGTMVVIGLESDDPLTIVSFKGLLVELGGLGTVGVYEVGRPAVAEFWFGKA